MINTLENAPESKVHHHECKCLTNQDNARYKQELSELQQEYDKVKNNEYKQSYVIEEQKKRIQDLGKTLALYERENKAMRELLQLWI